MDLPSPERWKRIEDIFDAALEQLPGARATFVRAACGDDDDLRVRVMRLLECAAATDPRLDEPAIDFAAQLLKHAAAESAPPLRPEIDRYRIMREIGRGGMGTVYLAERADFKQRVALKLIHHGLHLDEQLVLRFRDEREILASLEHPNIARLLDGGLTDDGLPYFVMEYVEGEALDRYCDANRLTIDERLALFCQICEAVQHAHVKGIVHRDLKPSNVLVTRDGRAKLLDFGIAKLLAADGVEVRALTRTGHRPMTPEYASPEQFRAETVGPTSDVYSLGVLLYELLTGQRPCRATTRTPHEFERAVLEEEPVAPSVVVQPGPSSRPDDTDVSAADVARNRATAPDRLPRRLRGDLDAIVLKSLEKQPDRRYRDAGDLADDIRRHLEGLAVLAQRAGWFYRASRLVRRRRKLVLTGVTAALLFVLIGLGTAFWPDRPAQPDASAVPVLAIGSMRDHRTDASGGSTAALTDMLATNLGRTDGLRVVSMSRLYEMLGPAADTGGRATADAARRAGATELLEGVLYPLGPARLRLDLRRIDLARGEVVTAYSVEGSELFAVADAATAQLVDALGLAAPFGSVAEVTTRSAAAYRLYADGLREFFVGRRSIALRLFGAALAEDSTFALAAYYYALATTTDVPERVRRLNRAVELADRAPDRERLLIRAAAANLRESPALRALADTLVVRYPLAVDGHFYLGLARQMVGEWSEATLAYQRVLELDSLGTHVGFTECAACLSYIQLVAGYLHTDRFADAVAISEQGVRRFPRDPRVWGARARALAHAGRYDEAAQAFEVAAQHGSPRDDLPGDLGWVWLMAEQYAKADALLREQLNLGDTDRRDRARNFLLLSLRAQGRLVEALEVAREKRAIGTAREGPPAPGSVTPEALSEAMLLAEMGRTADALALYDSIGRWRLPGLDPAAELGNRNWTLSQSGLLLASIGDTSRLAAIADELEQSGAGTLQRPQQLLHHVVRGLLLAARGDEAAAIVSLRAAYHDPALGFTRINAELASLYMRNERPFDAVAVLQPAVRGAVGSWNRYTSRTELRELLGRAWDTAGRPDSALVHYRRAADAWRSADPVFDDRVRALDARIRTLEPPVR